MSTRAQVLANQRNAQASSGPITPEGKAKSATNATRHGLSAAFSVLPHESRTEFEQILAAYESDYQPANEHENFLVEEMAQARWRLIRIARLEALAIEEPLTEPGSTSGPDALILNAMCSSGNPFDKLARYAAAARRDYHRAHRSLTQSRPRPWESWASASDRAHHHPHAPYFRPVGVLTWDLRRFNLCRLG